jgi:hypothetical protein
MATWTIDSMTVMPQVAGFSNVVYKVFWTVTDTDGVYTGGRAGSTEFSPPTGAFIPYADLTEAQVLGWVQAELGTDQVAAIEQDLNQQIIYMQAPPVVALPLPWQG